MKPALALVLLGCIGACPRASGDPPAKSWRPVLVKMGIKDQRVIAAMEKVSRADFLPVEERSNAWEDRPLDIGFEQTTSQPSLVAYMIEEMQLKPGCKVLEVGTGCGYPAAIISELCADVYTIDIIEPLARRAASTLSTKGFKNVHVKAGDGYAGWPELAPFDGIVVTAGAAKVPPALVQQLKPGARLVIPVGVGDKMDLKVITKLADGGVSDEVLIPVRFVPMTGEAAERDRALE